MDEETKEQLLKVYLEMKSTLSLPENKYTFEDFRFEDYRLALGWFIGQTDEILCNEE